MNVRLSKTAQRVAYEKEAQEYLRSLPLEHFMEATTQAMQRKITLESLDLVQARRPDVQVFNELLVQYPRPGESRLGKVVPDNMVVITDEAVRARLSYGVPLEPAAPFWTLEYVSKGSNRKDYEDSFRKYERDLKVPYYLIFHPEKQELTLYRHNSRRYVTVKRNARGRYAIPELDLEVAILDGWVRYWYRGELLPLPADLQKELDDALAKIEEVERRADELQQRLEAAERELAELRGGRKKRNSNTRSSDHNH